MLSTTRYAMRCARTDALRIAGTADDHQTPDTRAIGRAPPSWYPPPAHADTIDVAFQRGGGLVGLGHWIRGLLARGYSMNAITGMGSLYAGRGMTPAAYWPEFIQ
jgi:hypothetical protein